MKPGEIIRKVKKQGRENLTEFESREILKKYKIPLAKAELAKTSEKAVEIAEKIGFPIALKIASPQVVHKTDVGAVALNIKTKEGLRRAFRKLILDVKRKVPNLKVLGILVQEMVENGKEVIVGGKKDSQFGQVLMFGGGGILTEVLEDVSFRVCPVSKKDAKEMIEETKYYKVLKGYRGKRCDIDALVDILLKTSRLLEENQEIVELDINPVMALEKGAVAVDARIIIG